MTDTKHPVLCRCPGCGREAPADIDHWRREFGERSAPYAMREKILICPECNNRKVRVVNSWWEVQIDETRHWYIDKEDQPDIEKIVGVYLVNRAEQHYLCSSTPSYWLRCIGFRACFKDDVPDDAPDYRRSTLCQKYEDAPEEDSDAYYDCASIDGLPPEQLHHHEGIEIDDENEVVAAQSGNWWF